MMSKGRTSVPAEEFEGQVKAVLLVRLHETGPKSGVAEDRDGCGAQFEADACTRRGVVDCTGACTINRPLITMHD